MTVYTLAVWVARPGREDEFVERWRELAAWTVEAFPGAHGTLLRDRDRPSRFVSFGPWKSLDEVERWRATPEFADAVARLRDVLEAWEPGTYDAVLETGRH